MNFLRAWYPFERGLPRFNPFERVLESFADRNEMDFPLFNVGEDKNEFLITTELPGMNMSDIDVSVTNRTISIKGEMKHEEKKEENYHIKERISKASFSRHITLPVPIDGGSIKAQYKDGVLSVTVPKAEEAKPKSISIAIE